jgi:hypothetical protein
VFPQTVANQPYANEQRKSSTAPQCLYASHAASERLGRILTVTELSNMAFFPHVQGGVRHDRHTSPLNGRPEGCTQTPSSISFNHALDTVAGDLATYRGVEQSRFHHGFRFGHLCGCCFVYLIQSGAEDKLIYRYSG